MTLFKGTVFACLQLFLFLSEVYLQEAETLASESKNMDEISISKSENFVSNEPKIALRHAHKRYEHKVLSGKFKQSEENLMTYFENVQNATKMEMLSVPIRHHRSSRRFLRSKKSSINKLFHEKEEKINHGKPFPSLSDYSKSTLNSSDFPLHRASTLELLRDFKSNITDLINSENIVGIESSYEDPETYDFSEDNDSNSANNSTSSDEAEKTMMKMDVVTKFLRIVETQHLLGDNCKKGTDFSLGEGVVDKYAQERFRLEAEVAVNRANLYTRLWKYGREQVLQSEYLLHAELLSFVELDEDIFCAGNCYDKNEYPGRELYCPFAHRLPDGLILVKDLAVEYKYLKKSAEWFYRARQNGNRVIKENVQFKRGM